jgi:pyridoxamine 5'-phosphate oxidase
MNELHALRTEYAKASLDISSVSTDPFLQFEKWLTEAINAGVKEANAMCLASIGEDGRPSQRIVLLKGVEDKKFVFYTNYQSRKGTQLDANPICALNFFWPDLERQIRIEGVVNRISAEKSTEYFQSRPRSSQLGAWVSPQSSPIKDRQLLEDRFAEMEKKFDGVEKLPKPQQWGGYGVEPILIEFWQGRPSRLHDRLEYVKVDNEWNINRLAP